MYFSAAKEKGIPYVTTPSSLFKIASSLCYQLKVKVEDSASGPIIHNLIFALHEVHTSLGQLDDGQAGVLLLEAAKLLDSGKGKERLILSLTSDGLEKNDDGHSKDVRDRLIPYLIKKMGKIAIQMEFVQVCVVIHLV